METGGKNSDQARREMRQEVGGGTRAWATTVGPGCLGKGGSFTSRGNGRKRGQSANDEETKFPSGKQIAETHTQGPALSCSASSETRRTALLRCGLQTTAVRSYFKPSVYLKQKTSTHTFGSPPAGIDAGMHI